MSNNNSRETIQLNTEDHIRKEITMQQELLRLNELLSDMMKRAEARDKKVDEMYEYFSRGANIIWFLKWVFGTAVAIGGFLVMAKSFIYGQN